MPTHSFAKNDQAQIDSRHLYLKRDHSEVINMTESRLS